MPKIQDYFWLTVYKTDTCWLWFGTTYEAGYGQYSYENKIQSAHRVSWQMHYGPIPEGLIVCHKCDVPQCVNPDHLFLGTHKTNAEDRESKGRSNYDIRKRRQPGTHCSKGHELTVDNIYARTRGRGDCKICAKTRANERYKRLTGK